MRAGTSSCGSVGGVAASASRKDDAATAGLVGAADPKNDQLDRSYGHERPPLWQKALKDDPKPSHGTDPGVFNSVSATLTS
jgi:hypothetical protein